MRALAAAVVLILALPGCLTVASNSLPSGGSPTGSTAGSSSPSTGAASATGAATSPSTQTGTGGLPLSNQSIGSSPAGPTIVVAVVDTGINPYFVDFRSPYSNLAAGVSGFPANATPLHLSLGEPYDQATRDDAATWAGVRTGVLYTIPGTRIIGAISMGGLGDATTPSHSIILDDVGHGTATSDAVALNGAHVDLVLVQVGSASLAQGIAWAAAQPWINVISVSWENPANAPEGALDPAMVQATHAAASSGKIVLIAAGNEPSAAPTGASGPIFDISVGGAYPWARGATVVSGQGVDIVSDFAANLATDNSSTGRALVYGTSFATPTAAGTIGEAWWLAQSAGAHPSANAVRNALNATAIYWNATQYVPDPQDAPYSAAPVVSPAAQMGWGYVNGTLAQPIALALEGQGKAPAKSAEAPYMAEVAALRHALWG